MKSSKKVGAALLACSVAFVGAAGVAKADGWNQYYQQTVTVVNQSGYTIEELYMPADRSGTWGSDLLGRGELDSGYQINVSANPGTYAVKVVDGDGDECVVHNVQISGDRTLRITQRMLLNCEGYRD